MPAKIVAPDREAFLHPVPFTSERELQELLAASPALLQAPGDEPLLTVCRELPLKVGFVDIFLVDSEGVPVIVEVKLGRNEEARRTVIGQLCDYLSMAARLSIKDLDRNSGGKLQALIHSLCENDEPDAAFSGRAALVRSNLAACLRDGKIRGIIAVDDAPEDLIREFSYLNEQSALDLRLVTIEKYRIHENEQFIHSRFLVTGNPAAKGKMVRKRFQLILDKFQQRMPKDYSVWWTGKQNARIIHKDWPKAVHYEFCDWNDRVSVELQVKKEELPLLSHLLDTLFSSGSPGIRDTQNCALIPENFGWKRLQFFFDDQTDPYWVADGMVRLIEGTWESISAAIGSGGSFHLRH